MPRVEFTDDLVTGVADIDRHHRALISWANRLFEAEDTRSEERMVERTMTALVDYIAYHFAAEEEVMERLGYDGLKAHREQHQRLSREAERLSRDIAGVKILKSTVLELHFFVEDWIRQHIKHVDGAFARFVREQADSVKVALAEPGLVKKSALSRDTLQNVKVVHSSGVMTADQIRARLKY